MGNSLENIVNSAIGGDSPEFFIEVSPGQAVASSGAKLVVAKKDLFSSSVVIFRHTGLKEVTEVSTIWGVTTLQLAGTSEGVQKQVGIQCLSEHLGKVLEVLKVVRANNPELTICAKTHLAELAKEAHRICPFCAEEVKVAAIKCKHCGSELPPVESVSQAVDHPTDTGLEAGAIGESIPNGSEAPNEAKDHSAAPEVSTFAGCLLCFFVLGFAVYLSSLFSGPSSSPSRTVVPSLYSVTYKVSGTASKASLTYTNASGGTDQKTVSVPWQESFKARPGTHVYISAQKKDRSGTLKTEILLENIPVQQGETDSEYGIATASGRI